VTTEQSDVAAGSSSVPPFIVFSDDWGEHPSSCQHMFRHIAKEHSVIWVNTIGMRLPNFTWADLKKAFQKVSRMVDGGAPRVRTSANEGQVHVCQPFMLPFNSAPWVRSINRFSVRRTVRRQLTDLNLGRPIVVSSVPNACDYVHDFAASAIVYYSVDDFSQWPGLQNELIRHMEEKMLEAADLVFATSQKLYQRASAKNRPTFLLTHGVDVALFSREADIEHSCLGGIVQPRVGYFGLLDQRTDLDLIRSVATKLPDISFILTGPVALDVSQLRELGNVHLTGPIPYSELPALVKGLDVLFIAYHVNDFTDSISPLKLNEYLLTGKPIISTPLRGVDLRHERITVARTAGEWIEALRAAIRQPPERPGAVRASAVKGEDWSDKAAVFLSKINTSRSM
jgi:glycosyltransferase involved in cell wall biosynthesis